MTEGFRVTRRAPPARRRLAGPAVVLGLVLVPVWAFATFFPPPSRPHGLNVLRRPRIRTSQRSSGAALFVG